MRMLSTFSENELDVSLRDRSKLYNKTLGEVANLQEYWEYIPQRL